LYIYQNNIKNVIMAIKNFQDVNINTLPNNIRIEFEQVQKEYELRYYILPKEYDSRFYTLTKDDGFNYFYIHKETFKILFNLLDDGKLNASLHPNDILNNDILNLGFEEVEYKDKYHLNYYKIDNEGSFIWLITEYYRNGFLDGYNDGFEENEEIFENSKDELLIQNIFSIIYKRSDETISKCEQLFDEYFDIDVLSPHYFYNFGMSEGKFIRAWETITNYQNRFAPLFNGLILNKDFNNTEDKETNIDLSDTKATEKIIMLYKMGVFDFLRKQDPFKASTNLLASAISGITGIDEGTVQSYINPIDNPTVKQKNNPLTSAKTVKKVIQKLNSIGYIPIK